MDGSVGMGRMVDWAELLLELRKLGWSTTRVARTLNLPETTVASWMDRRSCEPRFSSGLMLIRLHAKVVGKARRLEVRFAARV